jgi:5-methylthioadenosine/S-adenosylhomocysteine deaminase
VHALVEAGVTVAVGMDEKELGDDKDYLAELRLASRLHRLCSHELDSPHLGSRDFFRMGTQNGAAVLGFDSLVGTLEPGKQADLVVLDLEAMAEPYSWEGHDPLDLLLYRGKAAHVRTVLVAGEVLVENGQAVRFDRQEVARRLREAIPEDYAARFATANQPMRALRAAIAGHFRPWYAEVERWDKRPYYLMNSR